MPSQIASPTNKETVNNKDLRFKATVPPSVDLLMQ